METFPLRGDFIELFKLLKITGLCESGGAAKAAVSEGLVQVDGVVETRKACKIRSGQKVRFEDHVLEVKSAAIESD